MHINFDAAEHEAAHVTVGLALGLRLRKAALGHTVIDGADVHGYTWFGGGNRQGFARTIMYCAGIAWESRPSGTLWHARYDEMYARKFFTSKHDLASGVRIAREMLEGRRRAHARIASELCDRDLSQVDIERLVLGAD